MSEIKRYHIGSPKEGIFGGIVSNMFEHPDGELVRWEDVEKLIRWIDTGEMPGGYLDKAILEAITNDPPPPA